MMRIARVEIAKIADENGAAAIRSTEELGAYIVESRLGHNTPS